MKGLVPAEPTVPGPSAPESPASELTESTRSFIRRWKHKNLFDRGFLVVPTLFLQHYAHLQPHPLSPGEALFVLHLMEFKWDADAPFPGYKTLAARMGVSDKMARRHAQSLEAKKYLRREMRVGQTNKFDLTPLFDALSKAVEQKRARRAKAVRRTNIEYRDAILDWAAKMMEAYKSMSEDEKQKLTEWEREHVDGSGRVATSDWPGWEQLIGKRPE